MTARAARAAVLLALLLAGCAGATGPSPAQQYQAAADAVNSAGNALSAAVTAANKDPVKLAPVFTAYADALRRFGQAIDAIKAAPDVEAAIDALVAVNSAEEVVYRTASRATTYDAMNAEFARLPGGAAAAANLVRVKLGLGPAPEIGLPQAS